jgi:hypothetical protein
VLGTHDTALLDSVFGCGLPVAMPGTEHPQQPGTQPTLPCAWCHAYEQVKAYTTRVGAGPYPTELFGTLAEELREVGGWMGPWLGMGAVGIRACNLGFCHHKLWKLEVTKLPATCVTVTADRP